jgi:hypothetical protein
MILLYPDGITASANYITIWFQACRRTFAICPRLSTVVLTYRSATLYVSDLAKSAPGVLAAMCPSPQGRSDVTSADDEHLICSERQLRAGALSS